MILSATNRLNAEPSALPDLGTSAIALGTQTEGSSTYLTFGYNRMIGAEATPYIVSLSDDLVQWDDSQHELEHIDDAVPNGDGLTERITLRIRKSIGEMGMEGKFLQVKVSDVASFKPFQSALLAKQQFNINLIYVDSFDSSDPEKSDFGASPDTVSPVRYGLYNWEMRQERGDVAVLQLAEPLDLSYSVILGSVFIPLPSEVVESNVIGLSNVVNGAFGGFRFPLPNNTEPNLTEYPPEITEINNDNVILEGGPDPADPERYHYESITLLRPSSGLRVVNPSGATESWIQIWVDGDIHVGGGTPGIELEPGVHAVIFFGGDFYASNPIQNGSQRAANLILRGYGASVGSVDMVCYEFCGVIYAPNCAVRLRGGGSAVSSFCGSVVGYSFLVDGLIEIHYDEDLKNLPLGLSDEEWGLE